MCIIRLDPLLLRLFIFLFSFVLFCFVLLVSLLCINHFESLFYTQVASVLRMQKCFDLHSNSTRKMATTKTTEKRKSGKKNKIANHLVVNDHRWRGVVKSIITETYVIEKFFASNKNHPHATKRNIKSRAPSNFKRNKHKFLGALVFGCVPAMDWFDLTHSRWNGMPWLSLVLLC